MDTDILEFGGKFWTLSGQRIAYMRDKTKDDRFFILTLFAIVKELQRTGTVPSVVEADLAVGLPPEHYELRQRFASYFKRGSVRFDFNGTPVTLVIRQALVYPQAYAAVVPQAHALRESPRTFIIANADGNAHWRGAGSSVEAYRLPEQNDFHSPVCYPGAGF